MSAWHHPISSVCQVAHFRKNKLLEINNRRRRRAVETLVNMLLAAKKSIEESGGIERKKQRIIHVGRLVDGISINEAMCFGLPIVCDGTEKHLVFDGRNGLYFKEENLDDMCDKIGNLLGDEKRRLEMGNNSERFIREQINIRMVIDGYMSAFRYVLR